MVFPPSVLDNVAFNVAFPVESAVAVPNRTGLLRLSDLPLQTPLEIEVVPVYLE
jgi:hypothetical protein